MSIRSITRTITDPSPGWENLTFKVIDLQWLQMYPNDKNRLLGCLKQGTQRLFEAYTPNSTRNHRVWKPFEHFKAETVYAHGACRNGIVLTCDPGAGLLLPCATVWDDRLFNSGTEYGEAGRYNSGLPVWYEPRSDGGFIPVPSNLEQLKLRGLQAMMPVIKNELSGLVSLYEIKDILSIRGSIKGIRELCNSLSTKFRGFGSRPIGRAALRQAADSFLQWKFNLRPLISDIGGIYRSVANYEKRINDLINRSGKLQTAHFMCNLNELTGRSESAWGQPVPVTAHPLGMLLLSGGGSTNICSNQVRKRIVNTDAAVFRCCMQYNYTFTAFQREHAKVLGLLDMLGVNFNPSYIWNVIPWSFVVDWVVNVSSWLNQFEIKNLEPKVNILQYCWSIRKSRTVSVLCKITSKRDVDYGKYAPQYIQLPDVKETSYRRGIDLPTADSFKTSGLSSTELSLGAALIITNRRRHRNPRK